METVAHNTNNHKYGGCGNSVLPILMWHSCSRNRKGGKSLWWLIISLYSELLLCKNKNHLIGSQNIHSYIIHIHGGVQEYIWLVAHLQAVNVGYLTIPQFIISQIIKGHYATRKGETTQIGNKLAATRIHLMLAFTSSPALELHKGSDYGNFGLT